jgi:hypothetical protein
MSLEGNALNTKPPRMTSEEAIPGLPQRTSGAMNPPHAGRVFQRNRPTGDDASPVAHIECARSSVATTSFSSADFSAKLAPISHGWYGKMAMWGRIAMQI